MGFLMKMQGLYPIYHALILAHYLGATYYNAYHVIIPNTEQFKAFNAYGGLFKYLTIWNIIIQSLFFWICLVNDLIGSNENNPKNKPGIRKFKDFFYCTIAFPLSVFVAFTFWGLYAIDRELVLPKMLDMYFPTWLNHVMHTNIFIFTMVELVSSCREYPSRKDGLTALTTFILVYLVWILVIYAKSGQWVYPVMSVLNWPQRILFFLSLLLLIQGFYILGEILNTMVWKQEVQSARNTTSIQLGEKKSH